MSTGGVTNAQGVAAINATSGSGGGIGLKATGVLAQSGVAVSVTGTTVETTLATITIPANALSANGKLRITWMMSFTSSANNKNGRLRFGGTQIDNIGGTTISGFEWQQNISALNSTQSQSAYQGNSAPYQIGGLFVNTSFDMTQPQQLTITGQCANAADTITLISYTVEILNP